MEFVVNKMTPEKNFFSLGNNHLTIAQQFLKIHCLSLMKDHIVNMATNM